MKSKHAVSLIIKIRVKLDDVGKLCLAYTPPLTQKAAAWKSMIAGFDAALAADDAAVQVGKLIPFVLPSTGAI